MTNGTERWTRFEEGNRLLLYGRGNEARVVYLDAWQEATGAGAAR